VGVGTGTSRRRGRAAATAIAVLSLLAVLALPRAASATGHRPVDGRQGEMQRLLDLIRIDDTAPGAAFTFGDGRHDVTLTSGTSDLLLLHRPIRSSDEVRVGSDTKMFVSTVALQLVGEGRLALDVPIDRYVPGVLRYRPGTVPGNPAAYDGRTVTLRQLLQHTAGVPEYADLGYILNPWHQVVPVTTTDLVHHALQHGPTFRPGTSWAYSNTDYALAQLIVERVTGRSLRREIAERIVRPLGLRHTFLPAAGQRTLPGPHVHGYISSTVPVDMTELEPSVWGAAGGLVSSADDMNTFLSALLAGKLLSPGLLAEQQRTVPYLTGGYGLGIVRVPLSCGTAWGHAGQLAGYSTFGLARPGGRHAFLTLNMTYAVNLLPPQAAPSPYALLELALC
jgi:D-alanyl-D-alanine carboxypeptidase